jgi:TetR/AcrR family transcriptional repressor of nem operon
MVLTVRATVLPGLFSPVYDYHGGMPGEPRTGRGRASRGRIVEHAAELVAERGVAGTSLDDVLAAAGASKSQLYHYFADRDELVQAAVAHRCAQVLGELTTALGDIATLAELEAMLGGFVAGFEQQGLPGCPIGSLASEVAEHNDGARLQAAAAFDAWEGLFADALGRMRERGELRADAPPGALATVLLASIEGGLLLSQTRKDAASLRIAVQAGLAHVRTYRGPSLD